MKKNIKVLTIFSLLVVFVLLAGIINIGFNYFSDINQNQAASHISYVKSFNTNWISNIWKSLFNNILPNNNLGSINNSSTIYGTGAVGLFNYICNQGDPNSCVPGSSKYCSSGRYGSSDIGSGSGMLSCTGGHYETDGNYYYTNCCFSCTCPAVSNGAYSNPVNNVSNAAVTGCTSLPCAPGYQQTTSTCANCFNCTIGGDCACDGKPTQVCVPGSGVCSNGQKRCKDSNTLQTCANGQWGGDYGCAISKGTGICDSGQCKVICTDAGCSGGAQCNRGTCDYYGKCLPSTGACDDKNSCTEKDTCSNGKCAGTNVAAGVACTTADAKGGTCDGKGSCVATPIDPCENRECGFGTDGKKYCGSCEYGSTCNTSGECVEDDQRCVVCLYQDFSECADVSSPQACEDVKLPPKPGYPASGKGCAWDEKAKACVSEMKLECELYIQTEVTLHPKSIATMENEVDPATDANFVIEWAKRNKCKELDV